MIYQQQKPLLGELPDWTRFPRPVGLWVMNEGSGSIINDLSGNRNTGILEGDTHWVGSALSFVSGNSNYIELKDYPVTDFTVIMWFATTNNFAGSERLYGAYYEGRLLWEANDTISALIHDGGWQTITSAAALNDGIYHQAVITAQQGLADGWKLYIDGVLQGTDSLGTITSHSSKHQIGRYFSGAYYFTGVIDHVLRYHHALSAAEIAYLYRNPFPWFVEDEVSHLYVPSEPPPSGSPYYYREFANRRVA